jgi:hypothetical protein
MNGKYLFLGYIFLFMINLAFSQTTNNLNGNWSYEESGTQEPLGRFSFSSTLTIKGENYMLYQERISEFAMHWDYCEIGRMVILKNEIQLYPEAWRGQMSEWYKSDTQNITRYKYILNGQDLVMIQNNDTVIYKKSSEMNQDQLLIYSGSMSGTQTLNIRLVIGDLGNIYYMYITKGNYGNPICLWGELENGVLLLKELDENYNERAFMRFQNFNSNANTITGIWQDLRSGRTANKYDLKLSK